MGIQIKTNLAASDNYGSKRSTNNIKYLVIHYTGNDGDSDEANTNYFKEHQRNASAHYFVDDDSVSRSVPDDWVAWSVGGNKYPNCPQTGGGKFYNQCTNSNSISIELCDSIRNGKYDFTENTLAQAAELAKLIMKTYNIPIERVIRHFDVTGKHCPGPFVEDPKAWQSFKNLLVKADTTNTVDEELFKATQHLVRRGVIKASEFNLWKRMDLIKLENVPGLLESMGGIDALVAKKVISSPSIWREKKYTVQNVRSLILKYVGVYK